MRGQMKENERNIWKCAEKFVPLQPFSGMWDSQEFHIFI